MSITAPPSSVASPSQSPSLSMTSIVATRIFINQLPNYENLSPCAEAQVSTIVRDMSYGCGDGSRTTSFGCFCYTSSTQFDSMIGAHVRTACPSDAAEETKARDLFSEYCEIPITAGFSGGFIPARSTSSTLISSSSASPSASTTSATSPSSNTQSASATSSPPPPPQQSTNTGVPHSTIIALSVTLPLLAILLSTGLFFLSRHRKNAKFAAKTATDEQEDSTAPRMKQSQETVEIYTNPTELPERDKAPYHAVELPAGLKSARGVAELEGGRF